MLDLLFGFNALDVQKTFETLGETGRIQYVYSSLILVLLVSTDQVVVVNLLDLVRT